MEASKEPTSEEEPAAKTHSNETAQADDNGTNCSCWARNFQTIVIIVGITFTLGVSLGALIANGEGSSSSQQFVSSLSPTIKSGFESINDKITLLVDCALHAAAGNNANTPTSFVDDDNPASEMEERHQDNTDKDYTNSVIKIKKPQLSAEQAANSESDDQVGMTMDKSPETTLRQELSKLREKFPNQNEKTWLELTAALSSTLRDDNPSQPAAITVLIPPPNVLHKKFAECFLDQLANIINIALAKDTTELPTRLKISSDEIRASSIGDLQQEFLHHFEEKGKVLITLDLDRVDSEEHLFFYHGVADTTRAMEKGAILLFPVQVPEEIYEKYEWTYRKAFEIADATLAKAWRGTLKNDNIGALITRVADSVILLNEGDSCGNQIYIYRKSFTSSDGKTFPVTYRIDNTITSSN